MTKTGSILVILFGFLVPLTATAVPDLSLPLTTAVQKRPYILKNEISGHFSYLPLDYFTNYVAFGGSYTHYFSDYFGWEVINANSSRDSSTGLEDFIKSKGAQPDAFDIMTWYATTNLVFTPMYTKNLSMSDRIMWGDISFVGGYGLSNFKAANNVSTIDAGVMLRFFSTDQLAIKFDLRQYVYFGDGLKPNLAITVGISYNFSGVVDVVAPVEEE